LFEPVGAVEEKNVVLNNLLSVCSEIEGKGRFNILMYNVSGQKGFNILYIDQGILPYKAKLVREIEGMIRGNSLKEDYLYYIDYVIGEGAIYRCIPIQESRGFWSF
ncbi:MAG: hypothetical protein AAGJ82_13080, partial [Bacteroidota bacterium]